MTDAKSPSPTAPSETKPPAAGGARRRWLRVLGAVIAVAAIGSGAWYVLYGRWHESTANAYVKGNVVEITPQVRGTAVSINVDDGDFVRVGDVLVRFDPNDTQVALNSAEADLANVVRKVRGLYSSLGSAQAEIAVRKVALSKAKADYERRRDLAASGAIPSEELEHARDTFAAAQSALTAAEQQYQTSRSLVDGTVLASHPEVQAAATKLQRAFLDQTRATLVAPVSGYVAKRTVQLGQQVQPGEPLMAVVPLDQVWIEANFTETQLTRMRIGQPVQMRSDLYGDSVRYDGVVQSLGIGTGGAFALLPAQNATGNWIKIVQRVPVRIVLAKPEQVRDHPLRIGLSMHAAVDLHESGGAMLAQTPRAQPVLDTAVYRDQLAQADALIRRIIDGNTQSGASAAGRP